MTAVVFTTLTSVVVITRSVLLSDVVAVANSAVEQEIGEFRRFADEGTDPTTATPFHSPQRLIEVYLSRQIPDDNEAIVGIFSGQLIQVDFSQLSGPHPEPLTYNEPLVEKVLASSSHSGVFDDPVRGKAYWGRVVFETDPGTTDGHFIVAYFTEPGETAVKKQVRVLSFVGAGGVLASVLIAWLIAGQIIAPIRRVSKVASTISNSDLTRRVPVEGNDEIAQLASTFNEMLDRLETAYNDQRQFVDDAGHELRTPITVVRGQLELLESSPPEERARSIELATTELDRMARMVNDLLTLAVADSGEFLHVAPVDVTELTIDIEDKARTINDRVMLVDAAEGVVVLDEQRVTEAILELYGNALRYSEGPVAIGSDFQGSGVQRVFRIWVRDSGPGVEKDAQETLFSRFSRGRQADPRHPNRPKGAGLGLSIVKAIGDAHGGRAYVESTVGLGSIFGLEIPAPDTADVEKTEE